MGATRPPPPPPPPPLFLLLAPVIHDSAPRDLVPCRQQLDRLPAAWPTWNLARAAACALLLLEGPSVSKMSGRSMLSLLSMRPGKNGDSEACFGTPDDSEAVDRRDA